MSATANGESDARRIGNVEERIASKPSEINTPVTRIVPDALNVHTSRHVAIPDSD